MHHYHHKECRFLNHNNQQPTKNTRLPLQLHKKHRPISAPTTSATTTTQIWRVRLHKRRKRRERGEGRGRESGWESIGKRKRENECERFFKILFFSFGNEWCSLDVACYLSFLNLSGSSGRLMCESFRVFGNIFNLKLAWLN